MDLKLTFRPPPLEATLNQLPAMDLPALPLLLVIFKAPLVAIIIPNQNPAPVKLGLLHLPKIYKVSGEENIDV